MKSKYLIFTIFFLLCLVNTSAVIYNSTDQYTNHSIELTTNCLFEDTRTKCDTTTECYADLFYSNLSLAIDRGRMRMEGLGHFNYTDSTDLNSTLTIGTYITHFYCYNSFHGDKDIWDTITLSTPPPVSIFSPLTTGTGTSSGTSIGPTKYVLYNISIDINENWRIDSRQSILIKVFDKNNKLTDVQDMNFIITPSQNKINFETDGIKRIDEGKYTIDVIPQKRNDSYIKEYSILVSAIGTTTLQKQESFNLYELQGFSKYWDIFSIWFHNSSLKVANFFKNNWIWISMFLILSLFIIVICIAIIMSKRKRK